jgi:Fur family transcriptional regulator, ferric uptake regulator
VSVPRQSAAVPARDTDSAIAAVRRRGLRVTASRRLVVEAVYSADRPVTAEEIASGMYGRSPRCDLASVYRNLETMQDAGLVRHVHLGHGPGLYAPAAGAGEYVACDRCGRSQVIPPAAAERLRASVREAVGYEASFAHFPITGLCPACQERLHVRS